MPRTVQHIEIDAAPQQVMAVLTDFGSYPDFIPEIEQVDILEQAHHEWEVRFSISVVRRLTYTLRLARPDSQTLNWSLVGGVFKANDGCWKLSPLEGGSRTAASYEISVQVGMFVPGNIMRSLIEHMLPNTLQRFKTRIEGATDDA